MENIVKQVKSELIIHLEQHYGATFGTDTVIISDHAPHVIVYDYATEENPSGLYVVESDKAVDMIVSDIINLGNSEHKSSVWDKHVNEVLSTFYAPLYDEDDKYLTDIPDCCQIIDEWKSLTGKNIFRHSATCLDFNFEISREKLLDAPQTSFLHVEDFVYFLYGNLKESLLPLSASQLHYYLSLCEQVHDQSGFSEIELSKIDTVSGNPECYRFYCEDIPIADGEEVPFEDADYFSTIIDFRQEVENNG